MSSLDTDHPETKPVMLIGPVGAGKSTLLKAVLPESQAGPVKKTEAVSYLDQAIDTPGEMITIPHFFNALILNSVRARLILFLMDASRPSQLPSRLALAMKAPVLGVISKTDLADENGRMRARAALIDAGVEEILELSAVSGEGLEELKRRMADFSASAAPVPKEE